jgi:hypothetical protein
MKLMARTLITPDGRMTRARLRRRYRRRLRRLGSETHRPSWAAGPSRSGQLRPVRSGQFHRVLWPAAYPIVVVPELSEQLSSVLEEFARTSGSTTQNPLKIVLRRGTMGLHRSGRAVDIYAVGGKGIGRWALEWSGAMQRAAAAKEPQERTRIVAEEKARNLGYKLYKTLQTRGSWAQPQGYPVQLFGPWTRSEGPHKSISERLLRMHGDHIHVAK